jgi:hypothetical protein
MKTAMKLGTSVVLLLLLAVAVCWSQELALYGEITKKFRGRDIPAAGYKIILAKGNTLGAPAYSSRTGKYGIYSLPGPLGPFTVKVYNGNDFVKSYDIIVSKKPTKFDIRLP